MPQASGWIRPRIAPACTDEEALATRDSEARTGLVISLSCDDVLPAVQDRQDTPYYYSRT